MILGIRGIEESSVYQGIFAKGRAEGEAVGLAKGEAIGAIEEARKSLLLLGRQKLGQPDERVEREIAGLADLDRLRFRIGRILNISSWDELMAPGPSSG
jgi:predicted transposase YdaD